MTEEEWQQLKPGDFIRKNSEESVYTVLLNHFGLSHVTAVRSVEVGAADYDHWEIVSKVTGRKQNLSIYETRYCK